MDLLPKWALVNHFPAIHDFESLTVLEQTARIYGAMNQLIGEYNTFADQINKSIEDFQTASEEDRNNFEIAMRQEFQDFIDIVDLRIKEIDSSIDQIKKDTEKYSKEILNEAIKSGRVSVTQNYDADSESLTIALSGGV